MSSVFHLSALYRLRSVAFVSVEHMTLGGGYGMFLQQNLSSVVPVSQCLLSTYVFFFFL